MRFTRAVFVVLLFIVFGQVAKEAPVLLSDAELDRVSAGYVDLEVSAFASAIGPNAVSRFSASDEQAGRAR